MAVTRIRSARTEGSLFIVETRPFTDTESHEICIVHSGVHIILPTVHQHS